MSRFDSVKFDDANSVLMKEIKKKFHELDVWIDEFVLPSRPKALAQTALEEAHMWIGKAFRDQQLKSNSGNVEEIEEGDE